MLLLDRNALAAVAANSAGNSLSISSSTLLRSGVAACSRCRVVMSPNRSCNSRRFTLAAFSNPLRSWSLYPRPMRVVASMNMLTPPEEKNASGLTGRPKNMSSFEYRKCSDNPGIRCS